MNAYELGDNKEQKKPHQSNILSSKFLSRNKFGEDSGKSLSSL